MYNFWIFGSCYLHQFLPLDRAWTELLCLTSLRRRWYLTSLSSLNPSQIIMKWRPSTEAFISQIGELCGFLLDVQPFKVRWKGSMMGHHLSIVSSPIQPSVGSDLCHFSTSLCSFLAWCPSSVVFPSQQDGPPTRTTDRILSTIWARAQRLRPRTVTWRGNTLRPSSDLFWNWSVLINYDDSPSWPIVDLDSINFKTGRWEYRWRTWSVLYPAIIPQSGTHPGSKAFEVVAQENQPCPQVLSVRKHTYVSQDTSITRR